MYWDRSNSPDSDELREQLREAIDKRDEKRIASSKSGERFSIGGILKLLRNNCCFNEHQFKKPSIISKNGQINITEFKSFVSNINGKQQQFSIPSFNPHLPPPNMINFSCSSNLFIQPASSDEIAGAVIHPTDPVVIRKKFREGMSRCKICKNRFLEKQQYERHLRDRHPIEHLKYLIQQEDEMEEQRKFEIEQNRLEEIATGGFIPPESEYKEICESIILESIPLPGEEDKGFGPHINKKGRLVMGKRTFVKKKISPQCPFCDKRFRNEHSLKKHIEKKHEESKEFWSCLRCFKPINNTREKYSHKCEFTHVCFECQPIRNLCTEGRLLAHRSKFHRGANSGFRCNVCNAKFLTPRKLRKHKKMAHVFTKIFPCHFCDEQFISEPAVIAHERIHTGIIKFECKICDYKCNRYIYMEEHKKEEHGYICSICQNKFSEWTDIKNHTLLEHGGYLTSETNTGYIECPRVWVLYKGE
uniref:C2H2-type domain-containing protein n=1 Tax=Strongyloides venezuelensis TaxID=75913 RepID=A0A0K0F8X9_STRVS